MEHLPRNLVGAELHRTVVEDEDGGDARGSIRDDAVDLLEAPSCQEASKPRHVVRKGEDDFSKNQHVRGIPLAVQVLPVVAGLDTGPCWCSEKEQSLERGEGRYPPFCLLLLRS